MEPSCAKLTRQFTANKVIDPDPGQCAKRDFESARPVRSAMKRIAGDPAFDLRAKFIQVASVAGQQIGLRQNNQVLMTIQFPDHFVITRARRVEVRNAAKVRETGFNATQIVASPANIRPGIDGGGENWKTVALDLVG